MRAVPLIIAVLCAAAAAPSAAAVIATDAAVQVTAYSEIAGNGYPLSDGSSAFGLPVALTAQIENTVFGINGYTQTFGAIQAVWSSSSAGQVLFSDFGWLLNGTPEELGQVATLNGGGPNWRYDFLVTTDSVLTLTYNVMGMNSTFGLQGWYLTDNGTDIFNPTDVFDPTASGVFTYNLAANSVHSLALSNNANISTDGYLVDYRGDMEGLFDWTITAVPEPGTWALLLTGFGTVGFAMRRRSRALAA